MTRIFTPSQFTATERSSADQKAYFANTLAQFIQRGCPEKMLSGALYSRLKLIFDHGSHTDRRGFYAYFFKSPYNRQMFLERILNHIPVGSPQATWSDVEKEIQAWLRKQTGIRTRFEEEAVNEARI